MERFFEIRRELGVFWRDSTCLQVGLDSRTGVILDDLTSAEQDFVCALTRPHTDAEIAARCHKVGIDHGRGVRILAMLQRAGVLAGGDEQGTHCVRLAKLDALGVAIGLALARSGITSLVFDDVSPVRASDHPLLARRGLGTNRSAAFLTELRRVNPLITTKGNPELTVVTGSRLVDPVSTSELCSRDQPHLLAWVEEVDVCIGPIVEPGITACAGCIQAHHLDADPAWAHLSPQAIGAQPIAPVAASAELAAALAARAIVGFLAGKGNALREMQWRVGPGTAAPLAASVVPHPECSCTAEALLLAHLEAGLPRIED